MELGMNTIARGGIWQAPLQKGQSNSMANFFVEQQCLLLLAEPGLTDREVEILETHPVHIGVLQEGAATFILFDFGGAMKFSCPYNANLVPYEMWDEDLSDADKYHRTVSVPIVDSNTGVIKGLRAFTIPPEAAGVLLKIAFEQREGMLNHFTPQQVYAAVQEAWIRRTDDQMIEAAEKMWLCGSNDG